MHSAHGTTEGHDGLIEAVGLAAHVADGGDHLFDHIVVPALVVFNAPAVIGTLGCPGFVIDGIDGVDHTAARVDPLCPVVSHFEILEIHKAAGLAGNEQHRLAAVAINLKLHLPAQVAAIMLVILNLH